MTQFTPVSATIGGALIGLSASWLWLSLGRVAGISGILGAITRVEAGWRVAFLVGMIGALFDRGDEGVFFVLHLFGIKARMQDDF